LVVIAIVEPMQWTFDPNWSVLHPQRYSLWDISGVIIGWFLLGLSPSYSAASPLLIVAAFDWFLDRNSVRYRWILCGLLAMLVTFPIYEARLWRLYPWWPMVNGFIGGIPGAVCSLLSKDKKST
jgi:hypothetical protein